MLNQYFAPHNFLNLTLFVYTLLAFDIFSFGLLKFLKITIPAFFRPAIWLLGLGLNVFFLFIFHFFSPFTGQFFYFSITLPALIFLPLYIKTHQIQKLFRSLKQNYLFFLLLLPLLPFFFIKTSLPPYTWDEMAYHYLSPYQLFHQASWTFDGLYQNLPRLLDTTFINLFAFTKTYATARLLHLSIFLTSIFSFYLFLKNKISLLPAIAFIVFITYLSPNLLLDATLGYVDAGTAAFLLLSLIAIFQFLRTSRSYYFLYFTSFASLALGSKYSALSPVLVMLILLFTFVVYTRRFFAAKDRKIFILSLVLPILLGGYWYLKNLYFSGNPIFPFFLPCFNTDCSQYNQSFFFWAQPITLANLPSIFNSSTFGPSILFYLFLPILIVSIFLAKKRTRQLLLLLTSIFLLDYFISSRFTGFEPRYFYFWRITLIALISISLYALFQSIWLRFPLQSFLFLICGLALSFLFFSKKIYQTYRHYLPGGGYYYQTQYALQETNINDWVMRFFPKTSSAIFWCNSRSDSPRLATPDPDLIWFTPEAQFHIFLVNCPHGGTIDASQDYYFLSLHSCDEPIPERHVAEGDPQYNMRLVDHDLVCNSEIITDHLYLHHAQ